MNKNKLAGIIVEKGFSQKRLADELKMNPKTFYRKMKRGVFGTDEVMQMINILDISNPAEIFLSNQ